MLMDADLSKPERMVMWSMHLGVTDLDMLADTVKLTKYEIMNMLEILESKEMCHTDGEGGFMLTRQGMERLYEKRNVLHITVGCEPSAVII